MTETSKERYARWDARPCYRCGHGEMYHWRQALMPEADSYPCDYGETYPRYWRCECRLYIHADPFEERTDD